MLHAQLEIWKAAVEESPRNTLAASWSPAGVVQSPSSTVTPPAVRNTTTTTKGSVKESPCAVDFSDGTFFFHL
jgi:SAM pointed domain-containing ETS transcription factor